MRLPRQESATAERQFSFEADEDVFFEEGTHSSQNYRTFDSHSLCVAIKIGIKVNIFSFEYAFIAEIEQ